MAHSAGHTRTRSESQSIHPTPQAKHPYLSGNFAPIHHTLPLTPCTFTGSIPDELADGEYVRNGSNPVSNADLGRDAHWFDGDGMLSGVSFPRDEHTGRIAPEFVNQFVLTDLYLSALSSPRLRVPILPSIATLVNPLASFISVTLRILRTVLLVILSHLPGSKQPIKKISVANTSVVYHDGRALALCESGPPMRIQLPGLETVGWYNGAVAEGEPMEEVAERVTAEKETVLGQDGGLISFMREWTTAHPKIDPKTEEMLLFHASFAPPYVQYSIIPPKQPADGEQSFPKMLNATVPGIGSAKMMHDFGVSRTHTVIMDLPLTLDPVNQLKGRPPVSFDASKPSRFGIFPRRSPQEVKWFETDASCIFHTANTWDEVDSAGHTNTVNMLACRLTSATLVFAAGNIAPPVPKRNKTIATAKAKRMPFFSKYEPGIEDSVFEKSARVESPSSGDEEKEALLRLSTSDTDNAAASTLMDDGTLFHEDQCRLYYYSFSLRTGHIAQQWALSIIPFEFPCVRADLEMHAARYVYGCSTTSTSFGSALGKATKIDVLVKMDARTLIDTGVQCPPRSVTGSVDVRSMAEVLESTDPADPIRVFRMPEGWYAQEARFVPHKNREGGGGGGGEEDDGYLLFYAFDESQLDPTTGDVPPDDADDDDNDAAISPERQRAKSELWILDAKDMRTVVARVHLPQRVPYGLHGSWFSADMIREQRAVERVRSTGRALEARRESGGGVWMGIREWIEGFLG